MPIRKSYGRKRQPTRAARKYKRKATPSRSTPMFKKKVMAVVRRAAEKKIKVFSIDNGAGILGSGLPGASGSGAGAVFPTILATAALAQGVEQEQRIGNTITNARLVIRGVVTSMPWDTNLNSNTSVFETHMVVFKNKKDPVTNAIGNIKQLPGNATGTVDGTLINTMYPYNRDLYKIQAVKKFNMCINPNSAYNTGEAMAGNQGWGKVMHRFVVDCGISKTLKWQDGGSAPTNDWVGVAFFNINTDGSIIPTTQIRSVAVVDGILTYYDM